MRVPRMMVHGRDARATEMINESRAGRTSHGSVLRSCLGHAGMTRLDTVLRLCLTERMRSLTETHLLQALKRWAIEENPAAQAEFGGRFSGVILSSPGVHAWGIACANGSRTSPLKGQADMLKSHESGWGTPNAGTDPYSPGFAIAQAGPSGLVACDTSASICWSAAQLCVSLPQPSAL